jgi:DNA-binding NarL/FixJ family response regulator
VRSVLVCLRTPLAAQVIANAAAQLGLSEVISTAAGGADALLRTARKPADVLLVDTASVRPDTIGFTRRVLERMPNAILVFFGPEEPEIARAAIAAGARGLIRGGDREDLAASVAKALMLLLRGGQAPVPTAVPLQRSEIETSEDDVDSSAAQSADASPGAPPADSAVRRAPTGSGAPVRSDATPAEPAAAGPGRPKVAAASAPGAPAAKSVTAPVGVNALRRLALTERELQVLRGMADGKSNAEIGRELFVSEDTVKTHARRLFRKLSARDRAHAVAAAFRAGLVR